LEIQILFPTPAFYLELGRRKCFVFFKQGKAARRKWVIGSGLWIAIAGKNSMGKPYKIDAPDGVRFQVPV